VSPVRSPVEEPAAGDGDGRLALTVTALFLVVGALSILCHEPWRDEAQAWLLARDSARLGELLQNARYEGGPVLWHLLLLPLTRVGGLPLMSGLNLAFAAGAVYLFARFSPFDRATRVLFAFGYLPLYEWGTIARSYAVGIFFLFLFAVLFARRRPILQGIVLGLAANTSVHAAMVSAGALVLVLVHGLSGGREQKRRFRVALWMGAAMAVAGLVLSAVQTLPPANARAVWVQPASLARLWSVLCFVQASFAPFAECWFSLIPSLRSPWVQIPFGIVAFALTLTFLATAGCYLAQRRTAWVLAACSALLLSSLSFLLWWRGTRHAGFLFIATLLALWLAPLFPERRSRDGARAHVAERLRFQMKPVLRAVLGFHAIVGAIAVVVEALTVFSAARATALLIRRQGLAELPIVIDPDTSASSVVAHLGIRAAYYPRQDRLGSFTIWGEHTHDSEAAPSNDTLVFDRATPLASHSDVVVVTNHEPAGGVTTHAKAVLIGTRLADVVEEESYWVYRIPSQTRVTRAP
jgi:hypothetical protein